LSYSWQVIGKCIKASLLRDPVFWWPRGTLRSWRLDKYRMTRPQNIYLMHCQQLLSIANASNLYAPHPRG
jgi:hypothetical protein